MLGKIQTILILLIVFGGVFLTSKYFYDEINDLKCWYIVLMSYLLLVVSSLWRDGFLCLCHVIRSLTLSAGMSVIGLILAIQGILQYLHVISSHNLFFSVTGSYENPAGFVSAVCGLFPFSIYMLVNRCHRMQKLLSGLAAVMMIAAVVLSQSRCGMLALCVAAFVLLMGKPLVRSCVHRYRWLVLFLALLVIPCLLYALYCMKSDSADGRLFVWQVCLDIFKKHPLTGYGPDGFQTNYMPAQADFFARHPDSPYAMLADNITHPFNEYVKLLIQYGIVGLASSFGILILVISGIWKSGGLFRLLALSVCFSIMTLCMFSYPFNYAISWFLSILLLLYAIPQSNFCWMSRKPFRLSILVISSSLLLYSSQKMYYELKWAAISRRSLEGYTENMLPYYKQIQPQMKHNSIFLYNYAADLNYVGQYYESLKLMQECQKRCNDYDAQMLLGDDYEHLGCTDSALAAYELASQMIPSRFVPLAAMLDIYMRQQDTAHAKSVATAILTKPIKMPSADVDEIRRIAMTVINSVE